MAILLNISNFQGGKYAILDADSPSATNTTKVQYCINEFEASFICLIFGQSLGLVIIAYLRTGVSDPYSDLNSVPFTGNPAQPILDFVINPFSYQFPSSNRTIQSKGLLQILQAVIFYEYTIQNLQTPSTGGSFVPESEVGKSSVQNTIRFAENKFNEIINSVESIFIYCKEVMAANYPTFAGACQLEVKASLLGV